MIEIINPDHSMVLSTKWLMVSGDSRSTGISLNKRLGQWVMSPHQAGYTVARCENQPLAIMVATTMIYDYDGLL